MRTFGTAHSRSEQVAHVLHTRRLPGLERLFGFGETLLVDPIIEKGEGLQVDS